MGRYDFRPARVLQTATALLETKRITTPPPWYDTVSVIPPSQILVRPSTITRPRRLKKGKKPSRMYQPPLIAYQEDSLRAEFFGDHPWELARPKVVLEDSGNDSKDWDWSKGIVQPGKRMDGESVIQRQLYLMNHQDLPQAQAYDIARKEFYAHRHFQDVERRIAKEEAQSTGAYFGKSALDIGTELEDKEWEAWKVWAEKETAALKQAQSAAYTGLPDEDGPAETTLNPEEEVQVKDEIAPSVPGSKTGQEALGGSMLHPSSAAMR